MRQIFEARSNLSQILLTAMAKAVIDVGGKKQNKLFVDSSCEISYLCVRERAPEFDHRDGESCH